MSVDNKSEERLKSDEKTPTENCYTETTVTNLTDGVLKIYKPHLERVQTQLNELTDKQKILVEQLHNENLKIAWSQNSAEYQDMFKKIQTYRDKLMNIKKEMRTLHEKSFKLKKRALKLQQMKEKEDAAKIQRRQKEEDLIAK